MKLRPTSTRQAKATGKPASKAPPAGRPPLTKPERAARRRLRQARRPDHLLPAPTPALVFDDPEKRQLREEVLAAADHRCQNCGSRHYLTLDHIVPRHLGGGNHRANLQCLCEPCNQAKGLGIWAPNLQNAAPATP